jgi:drug/metabolite transporter, DME family
VSITTSLRARAGLLAVSSGAVLWGTTGVGVRIVADRSGLAAVSIGWYRVAVAAVVVAAVSRGRLIPQAIAAGRRHPLTLLACGAGFGAYQALYFVGVQSVGVSVSTLVSLGVAPIALTAGAAVSRRRIPSPASLAVLGCAVVGLALVSLRPVSGAGAPHPVLGVLASLGSGLGYAAITVLSRRLHDVDPLLLTGATSAVATVVLLPFALSAGLFVPHDGIALGWLAYIGTVPTVAAYWLFYRGLRSTASEVAGVLTLLEPLTAAVVAALVLHEALSGSAVVGAALMLVAVGSLYLRRPVTEASAPPTVAEAPPPP